MTTKIGRVKIPVFVVIAAIPPAIRAAREKLMAAKEADSPKGAKVTPAEVMSVIGAFISELAREVGPALLDANGIRNA